MKKNSLVIIFCILFLFTAPQKALSFDEINKQLQLKENYSHLLCFDDKIIRYKSGIEGVFDIELLSGIYNNKHEMLIRPLKPVNTNLIVWTKKKIYNFDIRIKSINKGYEGFDYFEIDLPPGLEH